MDGDWRREARDREKDTGTGIEGNWRQPRHDLRSRSSSPSPSWSTGGARMRSTGDRSTRNTSRAVLEITDEEKEVGLPHAGVVVTYRAKRGDGWIRVDGDMPDGFNKDKDVYFRREFVRVDKDDCEYQPPIDLSQWKVAFKLHEMFKSQPRATIVLLLDGPETVDECGPERVIERQENEWLEGEVLLSTGFHGQTEIYIQTRSRLRPYFMFPDQISNYCLPLINGDRLKFQVQPNKKGDLKVRTVQLLSFEKRSRHVLDKFFASMQKAMMSFDAYRATLEMLPYTALWKFLTEDDQDAFSLLHLLSNMLKLCHGKNLDARVVIESLTETDFARNIRDLCIVCGFKEKVAVCGGTVHVEKKETILSFLKEVIRAAPHKLLAFMPLVSAIQIYPDPAIKDLLHQTFAKLAFSTNNFDATHWSTMASVPQWKELLGNPLHEDKLLRKVSTDTFYADPEEYMETYYRLTRVELFSKIQKGIKDLLNGCLDTRDMDCYFNVELSALDVSIHGIKLGLSFKTEKPVRNWESTTKLMFGNLLCISPNQNFDDPIWAVITNRDISVLKTRKTIFVELCEFNTKSYEEILMTLRANSTRTIMVESPTYFRSLWPVLVSLKNFETHDFFLGDKIIKGIFDQTKPLYTTQLSEILEESDDDYDSDEYSDELNDCIHYDNYPRSHRVYSRIRETFEEKKTRADAKRQILMESLDPTQQDAFTFCLDNDVAIVQGPPGCGKTYLGVKLVETILEWRLERPILVMTYKNHALDEFLKHCSQLPNCNLGDIIRIGSQSKEEALEQCNLATILKTFKTNKQVYKRFCEIKQSLDHYSWLIEYMMTTFMQATYIDVIGILKHLNEDQLEIFLLNVNWKEIGCEFQGKKVLTSQWVKYIMLPKIRQDYPSTSSFLNTFKYGNVTKCEITNRCYSLLETAMAKWLPSKAKIKDLRNLNDVFTQPDKEDTSDDNDCTNDELDDDDLDDMGVDYVQEKQESRLIGESSRDTNSYQMINEYNFFEKPSSQSVFFELSDFPSNMTVNSALLHCSNLWSLNEAQKIQFIFSLMQSKIQKAMEDLSTYLDYFRDLLECKSQFDLDRKVCAVKHRKIIGLTITGASIYHELLDLIKPQVVIVEEAAEILEPSLIAALHPKVEHLVLIGDHKQLRPQVDTYDLIKNNSFDISMMERLVISKAPFTMLKKQNRMRPEFSALLQDIYPELQDNLKRVITNEPAKCLEKSMYFWSHEFLEDGLSQTNQARFKVDKSKRNTSEAEMVMAIAMFLLCQGYRPSQITILAAYLGQQKVLRKMQKEYKDKYVHLFQLNTGEVDSFQIQTIDMYQGDENDFVLISLTRGNNSGSIGFLKLLNRRCVAQSRAKCGMYFVGNIRTFQDAECKSLVWQPFLKGMMGRECVGKNLVIQCGKHKNNCQKSVLNAHELMHYVNHPMQLCPLACGNLFECEIKEHSCKKTCSPPHRHDRCFVEIREVRPDCGHSAVRKCYEDLSRIPCEVRLKHKFARCGHSGTKKCYVNLESLKCKHPCLETMDCNLHQCPAYCGDIGHGHSLCQEPVKHIFSKCGHEGTKKCWKSPASYKCQEVVMRKLLKCQHDVQEECAKPLDEIVCPHPCDVPMSCKLHKCPEKCGTIHNHIYCKVKIKYDFPNCGHPSPKMKRCSEGITWECTTNVKVMALCGHDVEISCSQSISSVVCPELCSKERTCGHPCTNRCGDPCDKGLCDGCEQIKIKQLKEFKKKAKIKQLKLKDELRRDTNGSSFLRSVILNDGDTKAEYLKVSDKVMNYIKDMHEWTPQITKIEKVKNLQLEMEYEQSKLNIFGDIEDLKFHGTSDDGVEGIIKNGFRMPAPPTAMKRPGMYGQGIYFATDSSKSAQWMYTQGSHKLLLCQVLLGKSKVVKKPDSTLSRKKLRDEGFDSVFAPRGTAVINDEFVIFNPAQALPVYIIHYRNGNGLLPTQSLVSTEPFEIFKLTPSRNFNPNDPRDNFFRIAEAHFMRMTLLKGQNMKYKIKGVDYVYNRDLEAKFEETKNIFLNKNISNHTVLAFHGTPAENIESILRKNLDPNCHKRQAYGPGSYFSEFPDISLGYGNGLILFKTLPGKEYCGHDSTWPNYTSKKVNAEHTNGYGDMLIIQNPDQFMPFFVYHLE